jgi:hypothetical protein
MKPISRREFLLSLVPAWLTLRNVAVAVAVSCSILLAVEFYDFVRAQRTATILKTAGAVAGVLVFAVAYRRVFVRAKRALAGSTADFQSFVKNLGHLLAVLFAAASGAYFYWRWSVGLEVESSLLMLAGSSLVFLFRRK